jgi:hypothetical protein
MKLECGACGRALVSLALVAAVVHATALFLWWLEK